ncbi:MAG: low molecular weight phosphotyrosine protein phosphatase [Myxococcales bacterium]|nr:low molecular weight phosphotyrosine protein phosphatase [Myxococcales bacterium]
MIRLCFVCLGNICRSPTAEGIMRHLLREEGLDGRVEVDSAGTGGWHVGERADPRARETARARGFTLDSRARQVTPSDFARFDYLLAMDRANVRALEALAPDTAARAKIRLLRSFDADAPAGAEVPDPYYGGDDGFEQVFDICEAACRGLLAQLREGLERAR